MTQSLIIARHHSRCRQADDDTYLPNTLTIKLTPGSGARTSARPAPTGVYDASSPGRAPEESNTAVVAVRPRAPRTSTKPIAPLQL